MSHSQDLPCNFFELRPDKLSFYELFFVLPYHIIDHNENYVNSNDKQNVPRNWLIFFSLLVQKILILLAKPYSCLGLMFEIWFNSPNIQAYYTTLFNLLRGKDLELVRDTENFLSIAAHVDKRMDLDKNIKPKPGANSKYYGALAAMASKLVYENQAVIKKTVKDRWKMEYMEDLPLNYYNDYQDKPTTQACMFHDKNVNSDVIVVAFRGTEPFDAYAWCTDLDISWYELPNIGKIHGGFMKALGPQSKQQGKNGGISLSECGWPKEPYAEQDPKRRMAYYTIRDKLRTLLKNNSRTKFILTGHSLGGALAILFATILEYHGDKEMLDRLEGVYTFGQPRVGDRDFADYMGKKFHEHKVKYLRYVYNHDVVPRLPTDDKDTFLFKHFGICLYFNSLYRGRVVEEEPNKNYFIPLLWIIPRLERRLNAVWELIRGLMIGYIMGREYEESWLLIFIRIFGILVPGVADHNPQDYVNVTRIGIIKNFILLDHY